MKLEDIVTNERVYKLNLDMEKETLNWKLNIGEIVQCVQIHTLESKVIQELFNNTKF